GIIDDSSRRPDGNRKDISPCHPAVLKTCVTVCVAEAKSLVVRVFRPASQADLKVRMTSEAVQLRLERSNGLSEHFPMRRRSCRRKVPLGTGDRELDCPSLRLRLALFHAE